MTETSQLRKLQLIELAMLKEVVRICDKYGLTYYLSAGTFLGAVRHHGFIPWDDDADVRMPRPDYEKLLKVMPQELSAPYVMNHLSVNPDANRYHLRVEDPHVTVVRTYSRKNEPNNAWIDVFPLDGMPEKGIANKMRQFHLLYRRMWMQIAVFDEVINLNKKRKWYENAIIWVVEHTNMQKHVSFARNWHKLDAALKAYPFEKAVYLTNFMGYYKFKDMIPVTVYGKGALYPFEDAYFNGAEDYDAFLKHLYGDYMKLPPEDERNKHGIREIIIEEEV